MSLLAGGIAQLQAAMLTQMKDKDKPKDEDKSPEAVKPGSTTLPALAEVHPTNKFGGRDGLVGGDLYDNAGLV